MTGEKHIGTVQPVELCCRTGPAFYYFPEGLGEGRFWECAGDVSEEEELLLFLVFFPPSPLIHARRTRTKATLELRADQPRKRPRAPPTSPVRLRKSNT